MKGEKGALEGSSKILALHKAERARMQTPLMASEVTRKALLPSVT